MASIVSMFRDGDRAPFATPHEFPMTDTYWSRGIEPIDTPAYSEQNFHPDMIESSFVLAPMGPRGMVMPYNLHVHERVNPDTPPPEILDELRKHSNRSEGSRFPYKLRTVLNWVGDSDGRWLECGCRWDGESSFLLIKARLCELMKIKMNTLNVNLRCSGFIQVPSDRRFGKPITCWTHPHFTRQANAEDLNTIRLVRGYNLMVRDFPTCAVFTTTLEALRLFGLSDRDVRKVKLNISQLWQHIVGVGNVVFAMTVSDFITAVGKIDSDLQSVMHTVMETHIKGDVFGVVDIFWFAKTLSRFGPFESLAEKVAKFNDARDISTTTEIKDYYGQTYHNCFRLPCRPMGEAHFYNDPLKTASESYVVDDEGARYRDWEEAIDTIRCVMKREP